MRDGVMYPVLLWQVAHDPIRINSNADFTPANGVTGGDGSPGNPWIIDGWVIDGTGYGYGIYIGNTTEHFVVRNCSLHNTSGGDYSNYFPASGLVLYNVGNGTIANNIAVGNDWHGIFLYLSGNNAITGNNASNNDRGIRLEQSHGNLVANNTAMYNDQDGLLLYHSESNEVVNNDFFYNQMGMGIYNSATNNIRANNLSYNSNGIFFSLASNNILTRNMVSNNNQGFSIQMGSNGNVIYHNRFVSNMFQAIDHGTNFWDNGYPSGGNYWSNYAGIDIYNGPLQNLPGGDGLGDTPYLIGGDGGGIDNYTLIQPWFPDIEPPLANAGLDQTVDEDADMQFNGTASTDNNGICNYTWTFTDGGPVAIYGPMPFYIFSQPGNYTVTLTVLDRAGNADTDTMIVNVRDITPPQSDPMLPPSADEGQNVLFDGSVSSDNVGIVNYTWTFDDGGQVTLYGMFVNYTFSTPGIHMISLTVWDAAGHWGGGSVPITINDITPPTANAGLDTDAWTGTPYTFNGSASTDNAGIVNYTWEFVDGSTKFLYGQAPAYTFNNVGMYNVTLTVRDQAGFTDSDYVLINVRDGTSPVAHAGWDTTIDMGGTAWLSGSWSTDNVGIVNYTWNFTYGSQPITLYGINANYVLGIPGAYVITLTVYDAEGNSDSESIVITVIDTELPVANAGPDQAVDQGEEFTLDGSGSSDNIGIMNWTWSSQGTWPSPIYGETAKGVFEEAGIYSVILRVYDARGNMAEDTVTITVRHITPPVANAGDNDTVGQGSTITLWAGSSTDNVGIVNYTWTFNYGGNAVTLYGSSANHQFDIAGVYVVTLKVTDAAGYWDVDTVTITILDQTSPVAIAGPDQQVTAGTLVTFNGTASTDNVGIVNYTWGFTYGNGYVNLYGALATFRFNIPGSYIVTLGVMDAALNVATDMITITVTGEEVPVDSFPVTIGPVLDPAGNPIPGATVTLTINGTAYTGVTNATGHAVISIPKDSVGQDAEVEITKDGYEPVSYTTSIGQGGIPATQPPEMEPSTLGPDDQRYDYTWMYILLILVIVGVIGAVLLLKGKGKAPAGAPEEAVPREGGPGELDEVVPEESEAGEAPSETPEE
jgi:parallel beta-helix repeat protein